jgi:VWFA-related protein
MFPKKLNKPSLILSLLIIALFGAFIPGSARAADNERVKVVTVTINEKNPAAQQLRKGDFVVSEDGVAQQILSVTPANSNIAPLNLAVVIQDDVAQVNSEIGALQGFIKGLPAGSQVMVVYLQNNFVKVAQPFTADLNKAAKKLHVVSGSFGGSASPYLGLIDVMKNFNGFQHGRNEILLISSGIDSLNSGGGSPSSNLYLERAIKQAQKENITIYSIYGASARTRGRFASTFGQGALNYLSEQTGGYAFYMGSGFVSFNAPLAELKDRLNRQYVISYVSNNQDKGFRRVKIRTDYSNLKIEALKGYKADL